MWKLIDRPATRRRWPLAALLVLLLAPALAHADDGRVSLARRLTIDAGETTDDAVVIGGPLTVHGEVDGDAVAVGGSVEITGEVDGDVTAVGGSVRLGPEARVSGQVVSIGGSIDREPGARIDGGQVELAFLPVDLGGWHWPARRWGHVFGEGWGIGELIAAMLRTALLAGFLVLFLAIGRSWLDGTADRVLEEPWKAGLVGFASQLVLFCIGFILTISLIGIPILVLLSPVLVIVLLLGYGGAALALGRALWQRLDPHAVNPFVAILIGVLLIQIWAILAKALGLAGGVLAFTALALALVAFLVKYVMWTVGLGGFVLSRFARRPPPALPPVASAG